MKNAPHRIMTITQYHKERGLPAPMHPLLSVVDYNLMQHPADQPEYSFILDFYSISLKKDVGVKMKYGQQEYDFDEGIMYFLAPGQVLKIELIPGRTTAPSGWILLIHPDFLWNTPLGKNIRKYEYFDYAINEALFLSEKEEEVINGIITNIDEEHRASIDKFTQSIIISQIETLLNYSERFYQRQFITRKPGNHQLLDKLEEFLTRYFSSETLTDEGLPEVHKVAEALNVSAGYLSSVLKTLTGLNTQQHIHNKLIETAKQKLSSTDMSVSEIAYELGFRHSQSFSKFFKGKTHVSPLEFRQSFN